MEQVVITQLIADRILELLVAKTPFPRESFYSEIQDDFRALFIAVSVDDFPEEMVAPSLALIGQILNREMPKRSNDYSWVVGLKRAGEVVDSCFGGKMAAPGISV